ncbi:exodeoxyribonuclease VII small subunit [Desulfobacterales bacterium HSG16]|nr:exodeoxyribonuclease VII small subunit [Desulfobacterales bacterium HSG16]
MAAKQTFEKAIKQLEQIVNDLETGDLPLEKALKKFEDGVTLSKFCNEQLDKTEKKVTLLLKDGQGNLTETLFSTSSK